MHLPGLHFATHVTPFKDSCVELMQIDDERVLKLPNGVHLESSRLAPVLLHLIV